MKQIALLLSILLLLFPFGGCAGKENNENEESEEYEETTPGREETESLPSESTAEQSPVEETPEERAAKIVSEMTTDEKIGQVIMTELRTWKQTGEEKASNVTAMNDEVAAFLTKYHFGSVILCGENCKKTAELTALTRAIQQNAISNGNLPLLITADQEGGSITRLAEGCCMPGNMAIGESGRIENAALNGSVIGSELRAVGMNGVLSPVVDVNTNPMNPIIGIRAFSDDPKTVVSMATAMTAALRGQGIVACAKHFPGHGNTDTDSHTGLPLVTKSREEWLLSDGLPFSELIKETDLSMIMTAHIQYPGLDDTKIVSQKSGEEIYLPATLSKKILTGLLKEEFGFSGVVVTDAMNMSAIADHFGKNEAAVMALAAGADLLCAPVNVTSMEKTAALDELFAAIRSALSDGTLSEERLNDAVTRVVTMKIGNGILDADYASDLKTAIAEAEKIVGGVDNRIAEREMANDCVKLLPAGTDFLPFAPKTGEKVVILMAYANEVTSAKYAISRIEKEMGIGIDAEYFCYQNLTEPTGEMVKAAEEADYLILGVEEVAASVANEEHWLNAFPKALLPTVKTDRTAILCLGLPYFQEERYRGYPVFLLFNDSGMSEDDLTSEHFENKFGPMVPAGFDRIFGNTAAG